MPLADVAWPAASVPGATGCSRGNRIGDVELWAAVRMLSRPSDRLLSRRRSAVQGTVAATNDPAFGSSSITLRAHEAHRSSSLYNAPNRIRITKKSTMSKTSGHQPDAATLSDVSPSGPPNAGFS